MLKPLINYQKYSYGLCIVNYNNSFQLLFEILVYFKIATIINMDCTKTYFVTHSH